MFLNVKSKEKQHNVVLYCAGGGGGGFKWENKFCGEVNGPAGVQVDSGQIHVV
jgi:hypothetical protein